jgi:hypothetical protein
LTFDDEPSRDAFEAYVAFLHEEPETRAAELATLRKLDASEIEYRFVVGGHPVGETDGTISTDGERVVICVSACVGGNGERTSLDSRLAGC